MGANSKIEWTDATWNPVTGCTRVSEGCRHCYAERMAKRLAGRCGYPKDDPFSVTLHEDRLGEPLRWRKPRMVFVCSMGDLFHDDVPFEYIASVFGVMASAPQHTFQVLTKRPERMREWFKWEADQSATGKHVGANIFDADGDLCVWSATRSQPWPLHNVWIGVSAENQQAADERIPLLLETPAAVRFVSCEPLLGPVKIDLDRVCDKCGKTVLAGTGEVDEESKDHYLQWEKYCGSTRGLDWVITGSESGPKRRETDLAWVRGLRDQCAGAGIPFFLKQLHVGGRKVEMPALDGVVHEEFPNV